MTSLLSRVSSELALTVSTLRATLALHEESLPAEPLAELEAILAAQTEWSSRLHGLANGKRFDDCPSSPSSLSGLSEAHSPVARTGRHARTPTSAHRAPSPRTSTTIDINLREELRE